MTSTLHGRHAGASITPPSPSSGSPGKPGSDPATEHRIVSENRSLFEMLMECLQDAKAEDIIAINIEGKSPLADHMIIASGRSHRHVGAIADQLLRMIKKMPGTIAKSEGLSSCDWVLVDVGDIIVHLFRPEVRDFYNLEKMWANAPGESSSPAKPAT